MRLESKFQRLSIAGSLFFYAVNISNMPAARILSSFSCNIKYDSVVRIADIGRQHCCLLPDLRGLAAAGAAYAGQ